MRFTWQVGLAVFIASWRVVDAKPCITPRPGD
jgi:hypothetical protein